MRVLQLEFPRRTYRVFVYDLEETAQRVLFHPETPPVVSPRYDFRTDYLRLEDLTHSGEPGDILLIGWRQDESGRTKRFHITESLLAYITWDRCLRFYKNEVVRLGQPHYWSPDRNVALWPEEFDWIRKRLDRATKRTRVRLVEERIRKLREDVNRADAVSHSKYLWNKYCRAERKAEPAAAKAVKAAKAATETPLAPKPIKALLTRAEKRRLANTLETVLTRILARSAQVAASPETREEDHYFIESMFELFAHQLSPRGRRVGGVYQLARNL